MTHLTQAHRQWASRPDDERFISLHDLADVTRRQADASHSGVVSSRRITIEPSPDDPVRAITIRGSSSERTATPTHWAFGQLAGLVGAPAGYLRGLPAPIVADSLNYGLRFAGDIADVGLLLTEQTKDSGTDLELRAATGPRYGRVWNADVADALVRKFGDGVTGQWRVPGEFGKPVAVTKANTTLYASDRDMFVFLADEENRLELAGRRDGRSGSLARGFFIWNSEVGASTLGAGFFLYDYVCANRIVWGARDYTEVRIRHTAGAPDRWLEEIEPVLAEYAESSARPVLQTIEAARAKRLDDVDAFLAKRFGKRMVADLKSVHEKEEYRPIRTLWDVTTAVTAMARDLPNQDRRVELEREAGRILDLAA